jgi:hypothetical protein
MKTLGPMRLQIPINEALELVTICEDDVAQARIQASLNYRRARTGNEAAFWFGVLQAHTEGKAASVKEFISGGALQGFDGVLKPLRRCSL